MSETEKNSHHQIKNFICAYVYKESQQTSERARYRKASLKLGSSRGCLLRGSDPSQLSLFLGKSKNDSKNLQEKKIKNGQIRREREREIPFFQGLNKINLWVAEDFVSKGVDAVECDANGNGRHEVLQFRRLVEIVRRRSTFESAVGRNVEAKDSS